METIKSSRGEINMQKLVALDSPFGFIVVVSSGHCEQLMGARSQSRSAHFLEWPYAEDQGEVDIVENAIRSLLLQLTYCWRNIPC